MTYLTSILILLICAALIGITTAFIHHIIGSPSGFMVESSKAMTSSYKAGRIGSFIGRWVVIRFDQWELKHIAPLYTEEENFAQKELELIAKLPDGQEKLNRQNALRNKRKQMRFNLLSKRQANPYSILGACLVCFSTWLCLILMALVLTALVWTGVVSLSIAWLGLFSIPFAIRISIWTRIE